MVNGGNPVARSPLLRIWRTKRHFGRHPKSLFALKRITGFEGMRRDAQKGRMGSYEAQLGCVTPEALQKLVWSVTAETSHPDKSPVAVDLMP